MKFLGVETGSLNLKQKRGKLSMWAVKFIGLNIISKNCCVHTKLLLQIVKGFGLRMLVMRLLSVRGPRYCTIIIRYHHDERGGGLNGEKMS